MRRIALITALILAATPALATVPLPEPEVSPDGTQRWSFLVTYGAEDCPPSQDDEIVVCARLPESERYRIPAPLREKPQSNVGGQSWASHVESYQNVARLSRPDSCSAVGSYGQSGCAAAALRQWFAVRQHIEAGE